MTTPLALARFGALVVGAIALDVADYARLRLQRAHLLGCPLGPRAAARNWGAPSHDYERPCAAWCAGASHS